MAAASKHKKQLIDQVDQQRTPAEPNEPILNSLLNMGIGVISVIIMGAIIVAMIRYMG